MTPTVERSYDSMLETRSNLLSHLSEFTLTPPISNPQNSVDLEWSSTPPTFLLGYQFINDHIVLESIADIYRNLYPHLSRVHITEDDARVALGKKKTIDIALVTSFFYNHSVGRLLIQVIEELSKIQDFNIICYSLGSHEDDINLHFQSACNMYVPIVTKDVDSIKSIISETTPTILIYPEIGMDSTTYFLSLSRLSPIQAVFWGHPISQHTEIDYFFSSDLYSVENGRDIEYSEQILRFEGLMTYFMKPEEPEEEDVNEFIGVDDDDRVYLISQTLMKFNPVFDSIIHGIISSDPKAKIIITYNESQERYKQILEERLNQPSVIFVKSLPKSKFYNLIKRANVALDTFPFGGGVTMLETLSLSTPVVTCSKCQGVLPLCSGFLRTMGLEELDVREEEYVRKATEVAGEEWREKVRITKRTSKCCTWILTQ